jgi:serine/threonine protein kinase
VALKTLHANHAKSKEFIARFFNQAKVLSRLEHPSLVQVSDFGRTADGTAYLVME